MEETTVIDILNPMTNMGNNTVAEDPRDIICSIHYNGFSNFSTTNPEYTSSIFLSFYPEFEELISGVEKRFENLFNVYRELANHTLNEKKFGLTTWNFLMSSFIAHYLALTFGRLDTVETNSNECDIETRTKNIKASIGNIGVGLRTRESLGGEEIDTDNMINVGLNKMAGEYLTTIYGRAFWNVYISYSKNFFRGVY